MKLTKGKWTTSLAILGTGFVATANATPTTWTDYYNFTPDRFVSVFSPVTYTHDIRDGAGGFVVGTDSIESYSINLNLYDNNDNAWEIAFLDQPGILGDKSFFGVSGSEYGTWSLSGIWQLEDTGRLTVTISSLLGNFYLGDSTLTVKGDKGDTRVPEPGTLAVFGAALLAFGLTRRARKS